VAPAGSVSAAEYQELLRRVEALERESSAAPVVGAAPGEAVAEPDSDS
jgi:hypothetical protein